MIGDPHAKGEPLAPSSADEETIGRESEAAPSKLLAGRMFGDYELLEEIARGGMGVVFKARQTRLNRTVAVKMILAGQLADETDVRRFRAEAEAAAGLDHPGIVPVYESGEIDGQHFFSMGFVAGQSLATLLTAGPLPPRRAAELVAQVADAIEYAHQRGVIHRDLKPGNILLDADGHPRVTDFGLAKRVTGESNLTRTGQALGTPSYMPPEQAKGKVEAIGKAADVYALGAVLYAALTGRPPFHAGTAVETIMQVLKEEPVSPRLLNPHIHRDLETITLKCLQKEPSQRYPSAAQLAEELRRWDRGEPIRARPLGRLERGWRWCRRNPVTAGLTAAICLVVVVGGTLVTYFAVKESQQAASAQIAKTSAGLMTGRERQYGAMAEVDRRQAHETAEREKAQRLEAQRQVRTADALRLAAQAQAARVDEPVVSALLALEAVRLADEGDTASRARVQQSLRDILGLNGARRLTTAGDAIVTAAASANRRWFATIDRAGQVGLWDMTAGEPAPEPALSIGAENVSALTISSDAHWLAVAVTDDSALQLWNLLADASVDSATKLRHSAPIVSMAISPDDRWLAVVCGPAAVHLWDLTAADVAAVPVIFAAGTHSLAFRDSRRFGTCGTSGIRFWELQTDQPPVSTLIASKSDTHTIFFTADDRWLITANEAGTEVFDLRNQPLSKPIMLNNEFQPQSTVDGRWMITYTKGMLRVRDLHDRDITASTVILRDAGRLLTTTPDSGHLLTISDDGVVRLWPLSVDNLAGRVRSFAGRELTDDERREYLVPAAAGASDKH